MPGGIPFVGRLPEHALDTESPMPRRRCSVCHRRPNGNIPAAPAPHPPCIPGTSNMSAIIKPPLSTRSPRYAGNAGERDGKSVPHPVKLKQPNSWGPLRYDRVNVQQWCSDCSASAIVIARCADPRPARPPATCGWFAAAIASPVLRSRRSAHRQENAPYIRRNWVGLRLCIPAEPGMDHYSYGVPWRLAHGPGESPAPRDGPLAAAKDAHGHRSGPRSRATADGVRSDAHDVGTQSRRAQPFSGILDAGRFPPLPHGMPGARSLKQDGNASRRSPHAAGGARPPAQRAPGPQDIRYPTMRGASWPACKDQPGARARECTSI